MRNVSATTSLLALFIIFLLKTVSVAFETSVIINEIVVSNNDGASDEDGDYDDWIELHNASSVPVSLAGYGISDDPDEPFQWSFPDIEIAAGEFLILWASGKDRTDPVSQLHTNFSLSAGGESLTLTNPEGESIDFLEWEAIPLNVSYGRPSATSDVWVYYLLPTPGAANAEEGYTSEVTAPEFSHHAGFYTNAFQLSLSVDDPEAMILYTVDGSIPSPDTVGGTTYEYKNQYSQVPSQESGELLTRTKETREYIDPVTISDRSDTPNQLAEINTTWNYSPNVNVPRAPVYKGTVVRAIAVKEGSLPSPVITQTYFIDPEGTDRYQLPVIAITIPEEDMFGYESGIYVAGATFDQWRESNPTRNASSQSSSNFNQRGIEWERPAHVEFFEQGNGRVFAQNVGLRTAGGGSRIYPQKSLRLYARNQYDDRNTLDYPFFDNLVDHHNGRPIQKFRRLLLRNSGQDHQSTRFRDAFVQEALRPLGLDDQSYQPALHFINGEFWGLINMRESISQYYLSSHYNVDPDDVVILERNAVLNHGTEDDVADYLALQDYERMIWRIPRISNTRQRGSIWIT